ncbi:hypothetical protein ACL2XG_05355 [Sodalis sp. RH24]|uniref:DUF7210 family protein n=1 Tax=unclassified Sodalis (in: enterobacteria) TaxID=2636512 RepID=UPI0039B4DC28
MKMTAIKPIYLNRDVVLAGQEFETLEQHGRELIKKGYAEVVTEVAADVAAEKPVETGTAEENAPAEADAKAKAKTK